MRTQTFLDALSQLQRHHALGLFLAFGTVLFVVDGLRHRAVAVATPVAGESARQWREEEALYREAVARGLGDGDVIVRRRLVQKMRQLVEAGVDVAEPSEAELAAWMNEHASRYGAVERLSLDHVFLSRGLRTDRLAADADALRARLEAESGLDPARIGDPHPAGAQQDGIDARRAERLFGSSLAQQLAELPAGDWQGPLHSSLGLHFVRVRERSAQAPQLDAVRERAHRDYLLAQREARTRAAVAALVAAHGVALASRTP